MRFNPRNPDPDNIGGVKDSAAIRNGELVFRGTVKLPGKGTLYTKPDYNVIEVFIEPGEIKILSPDSLTNAVVDAGPLNKDFNKLVEMLGPVTERRADLYRQYYNARKELPENADKKAFEESWEQKGK